MNTPGFTAAASLHKARGRLLMPAASGEMGLPNSGSSPCERLWPEVNAGAGLKPTGGEEVVEFRGGVIRVELGELDSIRLRNRWRRPSRRITC
jgi:hypothetical protein